MAKKKRSKAQIAATKKMLAGLKRARTKVRPKNKRKATNPPRQAKSSTMKRKSTKQRSPAQKAATARMLAAKNGTASMAAAPIRQGGKERGHFTFPRPPFLKLVPHTTSVGPEFFRTTMTAVRRKKGK